MHTRKKGRKAEDTAVEYLLQKGYKVLSRNYQTRSGEIDCIAEDMPGTIAFIEVKSGGDGAYGHPLFRVTRSKQRNIAKVARIYLAEHSIINKPCRFDVITLINGKIEHMENAFMAG